MSLLANSSLLLTVGCIQLFEKGETGSGETPHTGRVAVSVRVTRAGADCRTDELLQLPAEYWWAYREGSKASCNDMSWYAWTDEGDCWEFSGMCGSSPDPFIIRDEGDPTVEFAECRSSYCR